MMINNIKFYKLSLLLLLTFSLTSCDPTIDALSFDTEEANSKIDETVPEASFGYFVAEEGAWDIITFSNSSVSASSYEWEFGDETGSVTYNPNDNINFEPTFRYKDIDEIKFFEGESKTFTVTLKVSDNNGLTSTFTDEIVLLNTNALIPTVDDLYNKLFVEVVSFSSFEEPKDAFPSNTLDGDISTKWTANDSVTGDNMDDGEYVIYDLGSEQQIDLLRFVTDVKSDPYGFQILYSTTGISDADFSLALPSDGSDLEFSIPATSEYQEHEVDISARYIKLISYGRFNATSGSQTSEWINFTQMDFWVDKEL